MAIRSCKILLQTIFILSIAFTGRLMAQSTIFNIPTTDTVAKGKVYAEFDFMPQVPGTDVSRTSMYNPRLVVGAPGNLEFGINFPVYNTRYSDYSSTNGYIQPNAKWRFYNNDKAGVALAVGGILNTPLNNSKIQDTWGLMYGLASLKIKAGDYSPRFHAGPYGVVSDGSVSFLGPRAGVVLGYEQPIQKKISIVADWYSGKNNLGYFTPGISITLPKNSLFNVGYSIGNDSWANSNATRNRYIFFYYGITF